MIINSCDGLDDCTDTNNINKYMCEMWILFQLLSYTNKNRSLIDYWTMPNIQMSRSTDQSSYF